MSTSPSELIEQEAAAETTQNSAKNKPLHKGYYKGVSWAVFPKQVKLQDGSQVTIFSTVIEGRYQDKSGDYQSTSVFTENQLAAVEDAAREARRFIRERREKKIASKS